jgi:hypothetical protein
VRRTVPGAGSARGCSSANHQPAACGLPPKNCSSASASRACAVRSGVWSVDAGFVMQAVDRLVQEDHRQLRAGQRGIELDASPLEVGLAEHAQPRRRLDRHRADRPAVGADHQPLRRAQAAAHVRAHRAQQRPGQPRIAARELRQAARQRMRQMLFGAVVQQHGLRVMDEPHQCVHERTQPLRRIEPLAQQDAAVGEIEAGVPPAHRHRLGGQLAHDERIRAQLEALAERKHSQLGGHQDRMGCHV